MSQGRLASLGYGTFSAVIAAGMLFCSQARASGEPALARLTLSPEHPTATDPVTALIDLGTPFSSPQALNTNISATLDGAPVALLHPAEGLWVMTSQPILAGHHDLSLSVTVEANDEATADRSQIASLEATVANLINQIAAEMDPDKKAQEQAALASAQSQLATAQAALTALQKLIGTQSFPLQIQSNFDLGAIRNSIRKTQNRQILIQNTDSGWPYQVEDVNLLLNNTTPSFPNQFGSNGQGLLDSYPVINEPRVLEEVRKTLAYLMTKTPHRKTRLYPNDAGLLIAGSQLLGFTSYMTEAQANEQAEKDLTAALVILGQPDPSTAAVDALPQAQLDAVPMAARAAAYRTRFTYLGQNKAYIAANFGGRVGVAIALSDHDWGKALADSIYADIAGYGPTDPDYLLELGSAVYCISPYVGEDARFPAAMDVLRRLILAQQNPRGFFTADPTALSNGELAEQGSMITALEMLKEWGALRTLINALIASQLPSGAYPYGTNGEYPAGQVAVMDALSMLWLDQTQLVGNHIDSMGLLEALGMPAGSTFVPGAVRTFTFMTL